MEIRIFTEENGSQEKLGEFESTAIPRVDETLSIWAGKKYRVKEVIWHVSKDSATWVDLIVETKSN